MGQPFPENGAQRLFGHPLHAIAHEHVHRSHLRDWISAKVSENGPAERGFLRAHHVLVGPSYAYEISCFLRRDFSWNQPLPEVWRKRLE
jgi:hypothetical protein